MPVIEETYDVVVVGAGHAGCEASLAAARLGLNTILFTISMDSVAMMPCNPNIGGSSKGHLVREIDALGGQMGINIDHTFIQSKMLNKSKGPAVHSLRAQADKAAYSMEMRKTLQNTENLTLRQAEVCEIIVEDGKIIGEGYHKKYGELHAERNAIASLTESAEGAVIYVTLEPCCHHGKTPPCTEAIIEQKIRKVVIGSRDPNPKVAGKGVQMLREAGVTVVEDFMREECDQLNPVFFHYITTKTPYVVMKYAMTLDGKIATKTGASKWITGESARKEVQHMRHQYMGIMAGIGTVLADDPMLNVRVEGWKSPVRIVCDSKLRIPPGSQIVKSAEKYRTIVAYAEQKNAKEKIKILHTMGVETIYCPDEKNQIDLKKLMADLGNRGIDSILLEGGGTLNDSALRAGIVKEVQAFVAPKLFGGVAGKTPVEGIGVELPSEAVELKYTDICQIGEDIRIKCQVCDKKQEESCLQES